MLDPSKRLSLAQIKQHKWMAPYVPVQRPVLHQQPLSAEGEAGIGEYSEQVLRLMHSLGIDQHKTIEVGLGRAAHRRLKHTERECRRTTSLHYGCICTSKIH